MPKKMNVRALVESINKGELTEAMLDEMLMEAKNHTVEYALRSLPGAIDHIMKQSMTIKKVADQFYEKNKELVPHKAMVAQIVEQAEMENPGLSYDQILKRAERLAKQRVRDKETIGKKPAGTLTLEGMDDKLGDL